MGYLLERLKAGRGNFTNCKLSGDGFDAPKNAVTIRLLTSQDVLEATLAANVSEFRRLLTIAACALTDGQWAYIAAMELSQRPSAAGTVQCLYQHEIYLRQ
jgi:hypothetical protein